MSKPRVERKKSGGAVPKGGKQIKGKIKRVSKDYSTEPINCTTPSLAGQREEEAQK